MKDRNFIYKFEGITRGENNNLLARFSSSAYVKTQYLSLRYVLLMLFKFKHIAFIEAIHHFGFMYFKEEKEI